MMKKKTKKRNRFLQTIQSTGSRLLTDEELSNVVGGLTQIKFEEWRIEYINNNNIVNSRLKSAINYSIYNEE